ncbi:hypothetical protein [Donghicola mangrovi]|uniref:Uncharacterized protein n=1 Tax=Donghicola mangrovi TaxID=2729614 RepID=A0A850QBR1_9RHOB|nr:hypothetical protein [Donghicola mangrovi]NVO24378.1 hypothetical protein [Donghicola mangrovi]
MYYYTTFEVTLGSWDKYGNNVGGGYTKMTVHPDAEPVTISVSPAPATSETSSYPDIGILSQYSASAGAYEVLSDLFFMDPKVGGDGSRWGHPGGQEITIVGPLYMADLSIDFGDGTFGHTKVLEFEYTPQIDDGNRHTAMIALSGDLPWVYDLNILAVDPVDFTDGSIDYVAR